VCLRARERVVRAKALLHGEIVLADIAIHIGLAAPSSRRGPRRVFRLKRL
jgi:hypothetical protein